jgi:hypothetical protein
LPLGLFALPISNHLEEKRLSDATSAEKANLLYAWAQKAKGEVNERERFPPLLIDCARNKIFDRLRSSAEKSTASFNF